MVKEIHRKDNDAQLLATIPGVGVTLATLISTEIDGIERFPSPSKLCSYAGLVPSTHSSGGKTYHGKITSEGNRWLRWALVEATVPASYADAAIKERLDAFREKKGADDHIWQLTRSWQRLEPPFIPLSEFTKGGLR